MRKFNSFVIASILFFGCQTVPKSGTETSKEALQAMATVSEAVIGQELSEQDIKNLSQQMRTDEEAKSAVEALTNTMGGQATVKYCPVDGERFAATLTQCPTHNVDLKEVGP